MSTLRYPSSKKNDFKENKFQSKIVETNECESSLENLKLNNDKLKLNGRNLKQKLDNYEKIIKNEKNFLETKDLIDSNSYIQTVRDKKN